METSSSRRGGDGDERVGDGTARKRPLVLVSSEETQEPQTDDPIDDEEAPAAATTPDDIGARPPNFESALPLDCRLRILSYLRPSELYGPYARTSRQSRSDSLRSYALPQSAWVELRCGPPGTDLRSFLRRLARPSVRSALPPRGKRRRVKLVGHSNLRWPEEWHYQRDSASALDDASLTGVTTLDISSDWRGIEKPPFFFVTRALVRMFPSLRELDLTNVNFPVPAVAALRYENEVHLGERAPLHVLRTVRWSNVTAGCRFLTDGYFFRWYPHLRELHLDNLTADCGRDGTFDEPRAFADLMDASDYRTGPHRHVLSKCNVRFLERVSLAGARYYHPRTGRTLPLPQAALVKLVRACPRLRWFRSDLAPGNVDVLRRERPDVAFVPGPGAEARRGRRYLDGNVDAGGEGRNEGGGAPCPPAYLSW